MLECYKLLSIATTIKYIFKCVNADIYFKSNDASYDAIPVLKKNPDI